MGAMKELMMQVEEWLAEADEEVARKLVARTAAGQFGPMPIGEAREVVAAVRAGEPKERTIEFTVEEAGMLYIAFLAAKNSISLKEDELRLMEKVKSFYKTSNGLLDI
jgi:hypothetical protein